MRIIQKRKNALVDYKKGESNNKKKSKNGFIRIRNTLYPIERIVKIRKEFDEQANLSYLAVIYKDSLNPVYNEIDYHYGTDKEINAIMERIKENEY